MKMIFSNQKTAIPSATHKEHKILPSMIIEDDVKTFPKKRKDTRFNMLQSMQLRKMGCRSCGGSV